MALIELQGVTKSHVRGAEAVHALDDVSVSVEAGEFVAVVGPSGSGKSTLLHVAGGLEVPDAGVVRFDGEELSAMSAKQRALVRRRRMGFVFQFFHLLPTLTVAENVKLPIALDGRRAGTEGDELIERLGLADRRDSFPSELSGGQMQRVAIGRALVTRPDVVLADEPTGNLDSRTGGEVLDVMIETVGAIGATLMMVTHDPTAAARSTRRLQVSDGRVVEATS